MGGFYLILPTIISIISEKLAPIFCNIAIVSQFYCMKIYFIHIIEHSD